MTTKYDVGDWAYFIIIKGKLAIEYAPITNINKDEKGNVSYRIGGHNRPESEVYDSLDEIAAIFSNAIKSFTLEPIL